MPTNEEVLNKIQAGLQARSTRGQERPQGIQYTGILDMPWRKDVIDYATYDVPTSAVATTDRYGISTLKYENYLGAFDNEDRLAKQQSFGEKAGNGVTKFLGKTGLIAADALATVTYGLGSAISQGDFSAVWDNEVSNFLDDQTKRLDRNFAHYYTNEEKAKGVLGQLGTANFWFNDVGNGLAFVAGTVLSEVPLAILTGGTSLAGGLSKTGARIGLKGAFKSADNIAINTIKNSGDEFVEGIAKNIDRDLGLKELRKFNRYTSIGSNIGEVAKTARFLGQSVAFEAGMEARHSYRDAVDSYVNNYQVKFGELPSTEDLTTFMKDAESESNRVFALNSALLAVTNFSMFSKMFDLKMVKFPKVKNVVEGTLGKSVTTLTDGTKILSRGTKAQRMLGNALTVTKPFVTEGAVEEGLQGVFGNTMSKYLEAKYDPTQADIYSYADALGESFTEQYTTTEGWKEIVLGGIIGLAGGNVGASIAKPLTALGVKGMEGATFGIEGIGKSNYSAKLNSLEEEVKTYNKHVETFRNLNRASSVGAFKITQNTDQAEFTILQDSLINYSFIKANEDIKGYSDTVADFNASVDGLEFTQEQQKSLGFEDEAEVQSYKESLKRGFETDYNDYKKAAKTTDALGIGSYNLSEGNKVELRDATILALMQGLKAGNIVNTIGDNISALTGINGAYSTLKFFNEIQDEKDNTYSEYNQTKEQIAELTTAIAEVGSQMQETEGNENLAKELSKKHVALSNQLLKTTERQEVLENALNNRIATMSYGETSSVGTINELSERFNELNQYVETLRSTGRTKEAKDLEFLLGQFNDYLAVETNAQDSIRRMSATNFYSSKQGKGIINSILGDRYSMSEEARNQIRDNEAIINPILERLGYSGENLTQAFERVLSENTDLSDREKFKIESMLRAQFAYDAIQRRVEESQEAIAPLEVITEDMGDTIEVAPTNTRVAVNNIEELSSLIEEITNEIDLITNKPTLENLRKTRENQARIDELQTEIANIENGIVTPTVEDQVTEEFIQSLRGDLEEVQNSEFPDPELQDQLTEQIETLSGGLSPEQEIEQKRTEIQVLETENNDLRTPFKFLESEGYKEYLKLLRKRVNQGTLTLDEQDQFETLENQVNQWISILGTTRNELELSDLIKQLVALENTPIDFASDIVEATDEEVIEDARIVNESQTRNVGVGQNYEVAVSQEVNRDGLILTSIHNYTLDAFIDLTGVEIMESEVEQDPVTKSFLISRDVVDRINEAGRIRITSSAVDETSTYYSMIRQNVVGMDGTETWAPLSSDYDNSDINREDVYNVREGELLTLAVDPNNEWNRSIIDAIIEENNDKIITDEQRDIAVEVEFQKSLNRNRTIVKLQSELLTLNNLPKTTENQAKINKKTRQVKDLTESIRSKAQDAVEARESTSTTLKISPELRSRIATDLRITAMNTETANVQVLKGTKGDDNGRFKGDDSKFASLRREMANDDNFLMELILNNNETPSDYTIKVKSVYPGLPNFTTIVDENVVLRRSSLIREQDLDKISDIGYVQNGKLYTRTSLDGIDRTFINTAVISNRSSKTPIVIIRQGIKNIAFPVRVARNESPINLDEFQAVFNNPTLEGSEKAIRLNTILATAGIDITQTGNAFIDLGNGLRSEDFDNLFSQLSNKEYLSSVDSWNDPRTSISEALVGNASISLDMSSPFVSPKIKFDLASIETNFEETEEMENKKKESTTKATMNTINGKAGLKNFNFCN